ncbi:MAG: cation transporter [Prochloron sp. SP5CPC1]|nr:cation transporter [Candidatus Paraprochloron terpiosi SP5CPC1]
MAHFWHSCSSPTCIDIPEMASKQRFRLGVMLGVILLFAVVEWLAGSLSHSLALRSDAWHMVADSSAILLALSASWLTRLTFVRPLRGQPPLDAMAAFANSLGLIVMAGLITWEAIQHLTQPPEQILSGPMFVTATMGLVINAMGIILLHEDSQTNLNVRGALLHMLADLASSVGVIISAIAIYLFQCFWLDSAMGLLIALFIATSAIPLLQLSWQQWKNPWPHFNTLMMPEIGRTSLTDLIAHKPSGNTSGNSRTAS